MSTSLQEIHKKIGRLKGKIIDPMVLELQGPASSIELLLQQIEATRRTFAREYYETLGEAPLLALTVKTINAKQVQLVGDWGLFEPFLTQLGVEIKALTKDVILSERRPLLTVK